jgi:outer membrane protein OmpA-like peptidoglycan-associated protein
VQRVEDKRGLTVELGGSSVNNLADNEQLFGLAPGSMNAFGATYTVFGNIVKSQYPSLLPSFYPASEVTDTSYLRALLATSPKTTPDVVTFDRGQAVKHVVARRTWDIAFDTGRATFTVAAGHELDALRDELVVASGTLVEIHGHTDAQGNAEQNMRLSEERAFAVKRHLEQSAPSSFPDGRIKVIAHGQSEPVAPNTTEEGRAKNRRVVIVLGTSGS